MEVPNINLGKIFGTPGQAPATNNNDAALGAESTTGKTVAPAVTEETATTIEKDIAPAVEHETVTNEHEQKEQTVIDKERHQDHYHTTIQPVKDREILPEQHNYEDTETKLMHVHHDDGAVKDNVASRNANFGNTSREGKTVETKTEEPTAVINEQVHHHLHETIQPVIEKETIQPTVTHKTIHVKEVHHDASVDEGTTMETPISVDELKDRLRK